jgi:hypothetical protein
MIWRPRASLKTLAGASRAARNIPCRHRQQSMVAPEFRVASRGRVCREPRRATNGRRKTGNRSVGRALAAIRSEVTIFSLAALAVGRRANSAGERHRRRSSFADLTGATRRGHTSDLLSAARRSDSSRPRNSRPARCSFACATTARMPPERRRADGLSAGRKGPQGERHHAGAVASVGRSVASRYQPRERPQLGCRGALDTGRRLNQTNSR